MKVKNIFDYLENETSINTESVIVNTGVSADNVLKLVQEQLNNEQNDSKVIPIRKKNKKIF